jgi:hypothetical protein
VTTIHVHYEILDDPGHPRPETAAEAHAWGVRAVGLPGNLNAYGVGSTLDEALEDLIQGVQALLADGRIPDELTQEITVTVGDAA